MYEAMLKEMKGDVDLVCCGRYDVYANNTVKERINTSGETNPKKLSATTAFTCDKLFRKDIIDKNNIRFPEELKYAEDFYFLTTYKLYAEKMTIMPKPFYFYNIEQVGSITNRRDEALLDIIKSLREINEYFISNNVFKEYEEELLICSAGFYIRRLSEFRKYRNTKLQRQFVKEFFKYFNEYFTNWKKTVNRYKTKKNKFYRTNKTILNIYIAINNWRK